MTKKIKEKCKSCKEEKKNCRCGAPTKLTERFIEATRKVLFDNLNAIIFTDEELLMLINEELVEEERISHATFESWKASSGKPKKPEMSEKCQLFLGLIKKALVIQKKNLFDKLSKDNTWQRYAWIIERKFDDWNIRHKADIDQPQVMAEIDKVRKDLQKAMKK